MASLATAQPFATPCRCTLLLLSAVPAHVQSLSAERGQYASRVSPSVEMSAHAYCLCPRGSNSVRGIARGAKADEVLVTIQNDGVVCYSSARQVICTSTPSARKCSTCMHCTSWLRLFDSVRASLA